jgi:hypothetical protein
MRRHRRTILRRDLSGFFRKQRTFSQRHLGHGELETRMNIGSRVSAAGVVFTALAVFVSAHAQAPIKAGLWEETSTVARGGGAPRTVTTQNCLTQQALDESRFDRVIAKVRNNKSCELRNLKQDARSASSEWTCKSAHVDMHGKGELVFDDADHFHMSSEEHTRIDGRSMDTTLSVQSHWISPQCGDVKPLK